MSYEMPILTKSFDFKRTMAMRSKRTPGERLAAAVLDLAENEGRIVVHSQRPWASITFTGSRHTMSLAFTGVHAVEAGERFVASLADHEFSIPRHLVADAEVRSVEHSLLPEPRLCVEIEVLLLDEG
ncbi:hypothetical protein [uncultured Croceicoccus sp.]|nr:hypothetical protein [uncultured Croceicoccus sp.]